MVLIRLTPFNYEYDVQGIVRAFYPKEKTITNADIPADKIVDVHYVTKQNPNEIQIRIFEGEKLVQEGKCEVDLSDRKETKNTLKRLLYRLLSKHTNRLLPWGTLSGIRPTKIPVALFEQKMSEEAVRDYMEQTYLTSDEKIDLSIRIAKKELKILEDIDYEQGYSLYIGIPFCPTTCLYCSFTSYPIHLYEKKVEEYLAALYLEMDYVAAAMKDYKLLTVYIGGGTPTTLSPFQMSRLIEKVQTVFDVSSIQEFTVEAGRPDSITKEKLMAMKQGMVSRISVNPQTMNEETLRIIGRRHTAEQVKSAFEEARECGFENINMDLILGLPGEQQEQVLYTMQEIQRLNPDSITVHSLALKRAARMNHPNTKEEKELFGQFQMINNEEIMEIPARAAKNMQMEPYYLYRQKNIAGNLENVGYAKVGKEGLYNILMIEEKHPILAIGAGASTKLVFPEENRVERIENVKDVDVYIKRIEEMIERKRKQLECI